MVKKFSVVGVENIMKLIDDSPTFCQICCSNIISDVQFLKRALQHSEFSEYLYTNGIEHIENLNLIDYTHSDFLSDIRILIDAANLYGSEESRTVFFHTILKHGEPEAMELMKNIILELISLGVEFNYTGKFQMNTKFIKYIIQNANFDIFYEYIKQYPTSLNRSELHNNPILDAIRNSDIRILEYLLTTDIVNEKLPIVYITDTQFLNYEKFKLLIIDNTNIDFFCEDERDIYYIIRDLFRYDDKECFGENEFDILMKRLNYDIHNADVNFFDEILQLLNPKILKHVIDKQIFNVNDRSDKTSVVKKIINAYHEEKIKTEYHHKKNDLQNNTWSCLRHILTNPQYEFNMNDINFIKFERVFDDELKEFV